ncbi:molybdate ABC transporter substrate-binding protein [Paenibacillus xylaniclasticus]|uniref:molybdate ABC transporter substrate-binding protein n=1 Tax=Paenibacillus xylaniclasticus TaxID=588083 RepID=UPI000FDABDAB|nr:MULTISPECIES: molybdate ABC transporter substrate-binding protein [Paenibacillus]GFN33103.1 molybdate ABC transporter substrate-binding protein [Paenibacillus curdlanolyticus]
MKTNNVIIIVIISILLLAACGSGSDKVLEIGSSATTEASDLEKGSTEGAKLETAPVEQEQPLVELIVSAAASLTDALSDLENEYERQNPSIELTFNFGASGALQQQIEQGAPVDLFLSASARNMNALIDQSLIEADSYSDLLGNQLVAVVPANSNTLIQTMDDLGEEAKYRIAIGIPESVPAGQYAQESLNKANLWEKLKGGIVQGKDVRQVLQYVETGNVDVGFVYMTDAINASQVKIAFEVDPMSYSSIVYPAGVVAATKHSAEAKALYAYLQTDEAASIFEKYGFSVLQ